VVKNLVLETHIDLSTAIKQKILYALTKFFDDKFALLQIMYLYLRIIEPFLTNKNS